MSTRSEPDCSGMCSCGITFGVSAIAAMTSSVKSVGCGEVNRTRSSPSISPQARSSLPNAEPVAELDAVGVDVLAEQGDLDDALGDQRLDLGEDVAGAAVLLLAAQRRDDAERAGVVAADARSTPRRRTPTRAGSAASTGTPRATRGSRPAPPPATRARSSSTGSEPMLWVPKTTSTQGARWVIVAAVLLRQAAADGDLHAGSLRLDRREVAEVAVELVVGVLAHRAGVEDDDVGLLARRRART